MEAARLSAETLGSHAEGSKGVGADSTVPPFHTDTDPEDPVYHDNCDCPYGREIMRSGNSRPGKDGR
jgi:H+-transporting ATPase